MKVESIKTAQKMREKDLYENIVLKRGIQKMNKILESKEQELQETKTD